MNSGTDKKNQKKKFTKKNKSKNEYKNLPKNGKICYKKGNFTKFLPENDFDHPNYYGEIPGMTFDNNTGKYSATTGLNDTNIKESLINFEEKLNIPDDTKLTKNIYDSIKKYDNFPKFYSSRINRHLLFETNFTTRNCIDEGTVLFK